LLPCFAIDHNQST